MTIINPMIELPRGGLLPVASTNESAFGVCALIGGELHLSNRIDVLKDHRGLTKPVYAYRFNSDESTQRAYLLSNGAINQINKSRGRAQDIKVITCDMNR